ncbi:MAG: ATP-grasp domain-containing protein [Planctomycetaceae bacterium]|nr:MAG: ATP-grasp domain-containing protein [Planctomycetaceae bacterium]
MTGNHNPIVPRCRELSKPSRICKDPSVDADRLLVIVGASARAAAESARQAGFITAAADLFGDRDLLEISNWIGIQDYPLGVIQAVSRLPHGPWLYTGGLENHPDLVDGVAAGRPLLGNPGPVLRAVRDPFRLADFLQHQGFDTPKILRPLPSASAAGRWLRKPWHSSGGRGIQVVSQAAENQRAVASRADEAIAESHDGECFYQQWIDGSSYSGVFVANQGSATLIGVTRQMVGRRWTKAPRFAYCGSIWPSGLDRQTIGTLSRLGQCLAAEYRLTGLFGVDVIVDDDRIFVLEINPRYPASAEVLEMALDMRGSIVAHHIAACQTNVLPQVDSEGTGNSCGKAILFADRPVSVGSRFESLLAPINADKHWTPLADIPAPGATIQEGQPIVTVRAQAESPTALMRRLKRLAEQVRSALDPPR